MRKKSETGEEIGRPEEIKPEDLVKRHRDMKRFLGYYWGRIGMGLKEVQEPEDVRRLLNSVPQVEWCAPFQGHAFCLIAEKASASTSEQIRRTRRQWKDAQEKTEHLWSEYHSITQQAQAAVAALRSGLMQFQDACAALFFFEIMNVLAAKLRVEELTKRSSELLAHVRQAQRQEQLLKGSLGAQEAWYARNEVVGFANNRRFSKTLLNCAGAMAGLPEWGWFHSRRQCEAIEKNESPPFPYQVFELLVVIIRRTKPLSLTTIEKKLRYELLRPDGNTMLRDYVNPHWDYLQEAIHHCRSVKRSELPYKIIDRFVYHLDRPKTEIDNQHAQSNRLILE